jgi:hypothetical protein
MHNLLARLPQTPEYLLHEIDSVIDKAKAAGARITIEREIQRPTGNFELDFLDGMYSAYTNVTNILVRVAPADRPVQSALLLSAHFDAAIGSPGASDDLAAVGTLMEVRSRLQHS